MYPEASGGWAIVTDVRITRRKYYHFVLEPTGQHVFNSRHFWQCVEYLDGEGVEEYMLLPAEPLPTEQVRSLKAQKEQNQWQK